MVKEFTESFKYSALQENEKKVQRRRNNRKEKDYETDEHRLQQRAKQIAYGENTPGYGNFIRALESNPGLLKGCLPVKPSVNQKCSKRSWDGQIRKWRRALHMYDFVDFGDSAEQTEAVRDALIDQNKNPLFTKAPKRVLPDGNEVSLTPHPEPNPAVKLPDGFDINQVSRVRYSFDDLMQLSESNLIAASIELPEHLYWLDKRVDLEDDVDDGDEPVGSPTTDHWMSPFTPGHSSTCSSPSQEPFYSPLGTPLQLFADTPGYTSLDPGLAEAPAQHRKPWGGAEEHGDDSPAYTLFKPAGESPSLFHTQNFRALAPQAKDGASYFTAPEEMRNM